MTELVSPERKIAGILAPLFALRREGDLGIGDTETLRQFVDWAQENGFGMVQMLPINELGGDNSPYNAISSVAIEPTTLHLAAGSPPELSKEGFDHVIANEKWTGNQAGPVNYKRVRRLKRVLLEHAFTQFEVSPDNQRQRDFENFCQAEAAWLRPYTLFRALMERQREREAWDEWPREYQSPETAQADLSAHSAEERAEFTRREKFFSYVQWIAAEQWRSVSKYSEERGVALMGDIPFGVSFYSADVFSHRDLFHLDWFGGAPPEPYFKDDEFTMKWGQNWGIPVYKWAAMRAENFEWWRRRTRGVTRIFHLFRIDHVLGFYRIYAFPWRPSRNAEFLPITFEQMLQRTGGRSPHFMPRDDETAESCEANRREGEEYLRIVLEESGPGRLVGEDLGTVPKYVRPSLQSLGIAGFKIPQWEIYDGEVIPGGRYGRLSVATYATHDHQPIRELWAQAHDPNAPLREQAAATLRTIAQFAGITPRENLDYSRDFFPQMMRALFSSNAWITIIMITDLLLRKDRFNIPGTAGAGNWTRRLPKTIAEMRSSRTMQRRIKWLHQLIGQTERSS